MMRKYIIGTIFGILLATATSIYATDVTSLIGRTIQGEFPVTIDGKELEKKALVIDGTSYVPLKAFGTAIGYDSSFDADLGITFKKSEGNLVSSTKTAEDYKKEAKAENDKVLEITRQMNVIYDQMGKVQGEINNINNNIRDYQDIVDGIQPFIDAKKTDIVAKTDIEINQLNEEIKMLEEKSKKYKDELIILQSKRSVLQTQIDALQTQVDQLDRNRHN